MSRPAPSDTPLENANDNARVDFTAVLPFEVMVHILEVGSLSYTELAAVRLVCTSLCAAASSPILYRVLFTNLGAKTIQRVAFPRHVVDSVRRFDAGTMCVADLAVVADQFPKVRAVRAGGSYTHSKRNPFAISKLCLPVLQKCLDLDVLADFSDLEALSLRDVPRTLPCHLLSGLRRLSLVDYRGDPSDLLTSLAASPCGARLEAFSLTMSLNTQFTAGWWEPLGDLVSLRELCVDAYGRCPFLEEDVDRFAALLATMSGLVTLALALSLAVADAVARHGLPSAARSLRLIGYQFLLDTMIPVMPVSLVALNLNGKVLSATNARGLLDQCPKLRVICADFQDDALAFLSTEATFTAGSRPPLLISDRYRCFTDADFAALAVAGHSVGTPFVGVHWHVKGGLAPDAEATVGLDL